MIQSHKRTQETFGSPFFMLINIGKYLTLIHMAYHIQKPSAVGNRTVYYAGGNRWTDDASQKKSFTTKAKATEAMSVTSTVLTGTRTGAGFRGATAVSS